MSRTNSRRWEVFKEFTFDAAHRLPNVPSEHKCGRLHGHTYHVTIAVSGHIGPKTGWVVDYSDISFAWRSVFSELDHNYLNDIPGLNNSTSEVLARWIWRKMAPKLRGLSRVVVRETCTAGCTYVGR